ncbi:dolichyl-phosphate-mannose-protein mannosyltransferase [bacterium BMS3Abin03]|nr:dolichyl-phosphate-mannose-protein mannosyltransferase [bacterium BMS3Abin03]
MSKLIVKNKEKYYFVAILLAGILLRLYFQIGHVFSDDAYYSYLSYTFYKGDFAHNYLGYPIFLLRVTHTYITAIAFKLFGVNETATLIIPFFISIANLVLTYKIAKLFTGNNMIALIAMLLMAFFPTDIIFATINFVDLPNMFFINLGIYLIFKSYLEKKLYLAVFGGFSFAVSMQIKENIYYTAILLVVLGMYLVIKKRNINLQIVIALVFILLNVFVEGIIYLFLHNDFFYRFTILELNYNYSYYDFFPYTAQKISGVKNYWRNLFDQVVVINVRSIFFRRFYLFLPIVGAVQTFLNLKKKEYLLLTYWFLGTLILLLAFTTSFTEFKPLDLRRSWYIYPLLMPMIIMSSIFVTRLNLKIRYLLIVIYIAGSVIMCHHYEIFFNKENLTGLKTFLSANKDKKIFTDHFTKYSIDLIRKYEDINKSARIAGENFNWKLIKQGDWILYDKSHVDELKMQKYSFPDFSVLYDKEKYRLVQSFDEFKIFEKRF